MANQQNGVTGILIAAFVLVILGVALIGVVSQEANLAVSKTRIAAEVVTVPRNKSGSREINMSKVITLANPPTGWKVEDCPITGVIVYNTTGAGASHTALTITTDYLIDTTAGTISFVNSSDTGNGGILNNNITNVRYDYCPDTYLNSGWGRTVLPLVAGFFALALLAVGIGLFYKVGKITGLI